MEKQRVLSGIQPSGKLTIGNYIGALRQWVREQDEYQAYFTVVDMHAITVMQDPQTLRQASRDTVALLIAVGIDPQKATVFIQSQVSAHAELGWILTCMTPLGWLYRMTQFKDKSAKQQQDSVGTGLLSYPTLMAADILLYQAHQVPVGDDQRQHLELTRDLAQRFNSAYGETFVLPEAMIPKVGARVMGLDNPLAKMSKSETSEYHAIYLLDTPEVVLKKCKRAVTDSFNEIRFSEDTERAGVNNLLTIYQAVTGKERTVIEQEFEGQGYGKLKTQVAESVSEALAPIQQRFYEISSSASYLNDLIEHGAKRAEQMANQTLELVKERIGFVRRT
ncbi:MAG: tryptophan--tRNA ligase [Anaerolineae bacterium]|nr:tryptophan--tRNA ligase [Anaerolineae bacterium]